MIVVDVALGNVAEGEPIDRIAADRGKVAITIKVRLRPRLALEKFLYILYNEQDFRDNDFYAE